MSETPETPNLPAGYPMRLRSLGNITDLDAKAQAEALKAHAERLYVHDPTTTRMITWPEFNELLRGVIALCDTVAGQDPPHG